jgi:hypothetical protein
MVIQYGNVMYTRSSARGSTGETCSTSCSTSRHRRTRCVHTPPCIPWCARTDNDVFAVLSWHTSTRAHRHADVSCTRAHPRHLPRPSPRRRRRPLAASAPPQGALQWKPSASWSSRSGVRRTVSGGGSNHGRTRTSTSMLQQTVAWAPSRAMRPCSRPCSHAPMHA